MANENPRLSAAFVAQQRKQLEALRERLLGMEQTREAEVRALTEQYGDEPRDRGDEGANMQQIDIDHALHHAGDRRWQLSSERSRRSGKERTACPTPVASLSRECDWRLYRTRSTRSRKKSGSNTSGAQSDRRDPNQPS
jgi:hypothetical protein